MKVLLFGATGMVGQGVLRECLLDPGVELVQTVGRNTTGARDVKLRQLVNADLWNYQGIEHALSGFDACFFCLGVTSVGTSEADYTRITYGVATAAAETVSRLNPGMTFILVSAQGADSSERGRAMWARVKGRTENAVMRLPFKAVYVFRPGLIQPLHGVQSKTAAYRIIYTLAAPLMPALQRIFPGHILTTEQIGRAMLAIVRNGAPVHVLQPKDITAVLS